MWQLLGFAAGTAIRHHLENRAERESEPTPRPRDRGKFAPIAQPLPVTLWVSARDFDFGLPFGWRRLVGDEFTKVAMDMCVPVETAAVNQRTDYLTTGMQVVIFDEADPRMIDYVEEFVAAREQGSQARRFAGPFSFTVGLVDAIMFHMRKTIGGEAYRVTGMMPVVVTEAWVIRGNTCYGITMTGPEEDHAALLPNFFTALGSWRWK